MPAEAPDADLSKELKAFESKMGNISVEKPKEISLPKNLLPNQPKKTVALIKDVKTLESAGAKIEG
jgi:hypothetical protein